MLCISSTSTPRSRILVMKSKWSRLALSTHRTSSNRRSSQLLGVRRWCACPGAQTITRRSWPTSEWTPKVVEVSVIAVSSSCLRSVLRAGRASTTKSSCPSVPSRRDESGRESVDADGGCNQRDGEDAKFDRGEQARVLLPSSQDIEDRPWRKENC